MTRDDRQEIDGLRQIAKDSQARLRRLEELWGQPDYFTSEQLHAMIDAPEATAKKILGKELWEGQSPTARDQTIRLIQSIGMLLDDAPPGSQVGLHVAGGKAHSWVREPDG